MTLAKLSNSMILCAVAFLAIPVSASDDVIYSGIDLWHTAANSRTWASFNEDPIPTAFFCSQSEAFTGTIYFQGVPLVTDPPGALGNTDTLMERLDDAVFDHRGVAHTRMQIKALSLVSIEPIETACGRFHVSLSLTGEQPISPHMKIVRQRDDDGYFLSEFDLIFKLVFTLARDGKISETLELVRWMTMRGGLDHVWPSNPGGAVVEHEGNVVVSQLWRRSWTWTTSTRSTSPAFVFVLEKTGEKHKKET